MRYFVTGATGFIGGKVAHELIKRGHQVVIIARNPAKAADLTAVGVEVHQGDITDKESMRAPMTGVDGVYHIAAWYKVGVRDTSEAETSNVGGTRNVLELMRELNIPKGVYTSTLAVNSDTGGKLVDESYEFHGQHLSVYDRTKAEAHHVAKNMIREGLPLVIVMPGVVYGPGDTSAAHDTIVQYLQRKLPLIPLKTAYSWAHIDDIVEGHILAMEKGKVGESYIIAGETKSLEEVLAFSERSTGIPAPKIHAAPGVLRAMSSVMGVVEKVIPMPPNMTGEMLNILAGRTYIGSNAKARRELGYNPRPAEVGLKETIEHELKQLGMPVSFN